MSDSKGVSEKTPTLKRYAGGFVKRILPARESSINDVFVNNHTKLTAIFAKCRKLLDQKVDYIVLHGLGRSIPKTIRLANLLKDALKSSINVNIRTGTVTAKDIYYSKFEGVDPPEEDGDSNVAHKRPVSVINIRVARVSV